MVVSTSPSIKLSASIVTAPVSGYEAPWLGRIIKVEVNEDGFSGLGAGAEEGALIFIRCKINGFHYLGRSPNILGQ